MTGFMTGRVIGRMVELGENVKRNEVESLVIGPRVCFCVGARVRIDRAAGIRGKEKG
jgi:hypothetical protein